MQGRSKYVAGIVVAAFHLRSLVLLLQLPCAQWYLWTMLIFLSLVSGKSLFIFAFGWLYSDHIFKCNSYPKPCIGYIIFPDAADTWSTNSHCSHFAICIWHHLRRWHTDYFYHFEDTTADAPRRSKRDSKRKAKERWAKTSCTDLNLACNFFLYNYVNSGRATCKWWLRTSHNNSIWLGIDFSKFQPHFKIAFQMVAPPSYIFPSPVGPFFSDFLCICWLK